MNFELASREIEDLIRAGSHKEASAALLGLRKSVIPRSQASALSNLARRTGLFNLGLRFMTPIMRPKVALDAAPTDKEKSTYALLLLELGAISEAIGILESGSSKSPEINLALAFTHMKLWDYEEAVRYLNVYLKSDGLSPYQAMVAKVNLVAALIASDRGGECVPLLEEILATTKAENWVLLRRNALELHAQMKVLEQDWDGALEILNRATTGREAGIQLSDVFVEKWKSVALVQRAGATKEALAGLAKVKRIALEMNHWETIRDCDYHLAIATRDEELLKKAYFGTPYESFRQRIVQKTGDWFAPPKEYIWQLCEEPSARVLDLANAEEVGGTASLKAGKGLHAAIATLSSDFYRPFVIGSLHSSIFPGEYFNPVSSQKRIAFLMHRLRKWFSENEVPLKVMSNQGRYQLAATGSYGILLSKKDCLKTEEDHPAHFVVMLEKLASRWPAEPFTAGSAAEFLGVSVRTARYLISWATTSEKLQRQGTGRSTMYRIS